MWFQGIMAVEMPQSNAQRRSAVIMQHVFPQMSTVHVPQVLHNVCSAQTAIDLTNLPQPSQTASYLAKIPKDVLERQLKVGKGMEYEDALDRHATLIETCAKKEHELHKTHYAFYHGLSKEVLFGILLNTELARVFDKHNTAEWYKLRRTKDFYLDGLSLGDYLRKHAGKLNDNKSPYRDHLLSVNLSFPGNEYFGESSFHYYCDNRSIADSAKVKIFFANFISPYIPDCYANLTDHIATLVEKLVQKLNTMSDTGALLQIFIPKEMVDESAFLCCPAGLPPFNSELFIGKGGFFTKISYKFADTSLGEIDPLSSYYTKISPALENYQHGCTKLERSELFKMQARLRLDSEKFNNSQSGIKFCLHHEFPEQEFINLKNEIRMLVQDFIAHKDIQFLLSLYQECTYKPYDHSALEDAILASETAYKMCKKTLVLVDPLQPLAQYFTAHKHSLNNQEVSSLQKLVAQHPRLGFATSKPLKICSCRTKLPVEKIVVSPDGSKMVLLFKDKTVSIFDLVTFQNIFPVFDKQCDIFHAAQFSSDSSKVFFINKNRTINAIYCIDLTKKMFEPFVYSGSSYKRMYDSCRDAESLYSPDGKKVAVVRYNCVCIRAAGTKKNLVTLTHDQHAEKIVFSHDGTKIATCVWNRDVSIWDVATGTRLLAFDKNYHNNYCGIAFSPDDTKLIFTSAYKTVSLCDVATGNILATFEHYKAISGTAFSTDGSKIFTVGEDGEINVWDAVTYKKIMNYSHPYQIFKFAVSRDGMKIVVGAADGTVFLFDACTGKKIVTFKHDDGIKLLEFSSDSTKLFSASRDGMMSVWDVKEDTLATWLQQKIAPTVFKVQKQLVALPSVQVFMESLL